MIELTREETIEALECCGSNEYICKTSCPLFPGTDAQCAQTIACNVLSYFVKKEPAPSANDTSSEDYLQEYNNANSAVCQGEVVSKLFCKADRACNSVMCMYDNMTDAEQRAFDIGKTYRDMLSVRNELEELKLRGGDKK